MHRGQRKRQSGNFVPLQKQESALGVAAMIRLASLAEPGRRAEAGDARLVSGTDAAGHDLVRPFIMTGGRPRPARRDLRVETMLRRSEERRVGEELVRSGRARW